MTRRILITLACFALPFILYWIYDWMQRRSARVTAGSTALARREKWPMTILWLAGAVLAVETMIVAAVSDPGYRGNGRYVPAHMEDGKIVPDRFEPAPPPAPKP